MTTKTFQIQWQINAIHLKIEIARLKERLKQLERSEVKEGDLR